MGGICGMWCGWHLNDNVCKFSSATQGYGEKMERDVKVRATLTVVLDAFVKIGESAFKLNMT